MDDKDKKKLIDRFETASKKMKEGKAGSSDAEVAYAIAYQDLVKAGLAQQIKQKYRKA